VNWLGGRRQDSLIYRLARRLVGRPQPAIQDPNTTYDRQTIEVMARVLSRHSGCIDLGAHKGDILRHMVRMAPDGTHHAFEPLAHMADELRTRFKRVHVHQMAVSDRSGVSENDPGYSGLRRREYDRPDPRIRAIQVAVTTLDEVIPADQPIRFVKIDIEGGEYHALKGAVNTIQRWRPVIVFEAGSRSTGQYGVTPDDLLRLIVTDFGYELSTMRRWLDRRPAYSAEEFRHNWEAGPDYYFIATPSEPI
jgi:FkbM family methyltransferase